MTLQPENPQLGRHSFQGWEEAHAALLAAGFCHLPGSDMPDNRHYRWISPAGRVLRCDVTPPLDRRQGGVVAFIWAATS